MSARPGLHQSIATWGAIAAIGFALAGVIFTAGDARQMQISDHARVGALETHSQTQDKELADLHEAVAVMASQLTDVQATVHHVDGSPIPVKR